MIGTSTWSAGAKAARAGVPVTACPYSEDDYDFVTWMNGWAAARNSMAVEAARSAKKADAADVGGNDDLF